MSDVTAGSAPLDDAMLTMDVADTLRFRQDLPVDSQQLLAALRDIYRQQGISVSDQILREGIAAHQERRFDYAPPRDGIGTALARLYVNRRRWSRPLLTWLFVLFVAVGSYFALWQPYQRSQAEQARLALSEGVPAQIEALYQTIFDETKVQQAVMRARALRQRGKAYAAEGNSIAARDIVDDLAAMRDQLRQDYVLRVVPDAQPGFWTIPEVSTAATNYYLVVEAIGADGRPVSLPVLDEESGETDQVSRWGVRVPEAVYDGILADRRDDGVIENGIVGRKPSGYLDVIYTLPVLGGTVTRW